MEQCWKWFLKVVTTKYAQFEGRAHHEEYWSFFVVSVLISIGLWILGHIPGLGIFNGLFRLGIFLPSLAAGARRLHDTDRSGWWQLIVLIPIIGFIVLIVLLAQKGQPGVNRYGEDPLQPAA